MFKPFIKLSVLLFTLVVISGAAHAAQTLHTVKYGAHIRQELDIYLPANIKGNDNAAVLFYVHGGAWVTGDKKIASKHAAFYTNKNIIFVAVNYRLSPDHKHPAHIQDVASALAWAHQNIANYGGDNENIHISGHSAGAHLVALLGTDDSYLSAYDLDLDSIKTVIAVDTASFDFTYRPKTQPRIIQKAIKSAFGDNQNDLKQASPFHKIAPNKNAPDFLLFVTKRRDDAVRQTSRFKQKLTQNAIKAESYIIPNYTHREMNQAMYDNTSDVAQKILNVIEN